MIEEANHEIWAAVEQEILRRAERVRLRAMIAQIDDLFWELEDLNLRDEKTVPRDLWADVATVVAACLKVRPEDIPVRRRISNALDVLYETQATLIDRKSASLGLALEDDNDYLDGHHHGAFSQAAPLQLFG